MELFKAAEGSPVESDLLYYWSEIATSSTTFSTGGFDEDIVGGHGTHVAGSAAGASIPIYGDSYVTSCAGGEVRTATRRVGLTWQQRVWAVAVLIFGCCNQRDMTKMAAQVVRR